MRQFIGPTILLILYLLAACRYFPGRPLDTLVATLTHLAQSLPVAVATAFLVVLVVRKVSGALPSRPAMAKTLLIIALLFELLYSLHHFYNGAI